MNHGISKPIVATAKATGGGIRREELNGIRTRAKLRHHQRGVEHSWAFWQLRQMIAYKAARAGVLVEFVASAQHQPDVLPLCHCEKGNCRNQSDFGCRSCRYQAHADINAAENIRQGRSKEANVTWFRIVCRIRFASAGFQPLAFSRGWFTAAALLAPHPSYTRPATDSAIPPVAFSVPAVM